MLRISSFTGRPFTITSPEVGSIRPHIMDRSVDLPQPDGPTMDMNCPFFTFYFICKITFVHFAHIIFVFSFKTHKQKNARTSILKELLYLPKPTFFL